MLNGNQTELAMKEANLIAVVEKTLPDFALNLRLTYGQPRTKLVLQYLEQAGYRRMC
jgi:hypothetical protein